MIRVLAGFLPVTALILLAILNASLASTRTELSLPINEENVLSSVRSRAYFPATLIPEIRYQILSYLNQTDLLKRLRPASKELKSLVEDYYKAKDIALKVLCPFNEKESEYIHHYGSNYLFGYVYTSVVYLQNLYYYPPMSPPFAFVRSLEISMPKDLPLGRKEQLLNAFLTKNPFLQRLSLENNNLQPLEGHVIGRALKSNSNLTELNLAGNIICTTGARSIFSALEKNKMLEYLNLSGNGLGSPAEGETEFIGKTLGINLTTRHFL